MANNNDHDDDDIVSNSFRPLLFLLASSTPDIYTAQRRHACVRDAASYLQESEACRAYLATCRDGMFMYSVYWCNVLYSVALLYSVVLLVFWITNVVG